MELKALSDKELAERIINYIERADKLRCYISKFMEENHFPITQRDEIRDEYKMLKEELRQDAHYLSLARNLDGSEIYESFFKPSILEAAAFGFTVVINKPINYSMYNSVSEAHYKLTKYYSLEKWKAILIIDSFINT